MDITNELNEIIIKYHLDRHYPRFQKKVKAEKILKEEFYKQVKNKKRIILFGINQDDIDYAKRFLPYAGVFVECLWSEKEQPKVLHANGAEVIYLVSFHNREALTEFLEIYEIPYIDIYDLFEVEGIICEDEYYHLFLNDSYMTGGFGKRAGWMEKPQLEYYFLNKKFERAEAASYRLLYAEKMLFVALYMKNFLLADDCVKHLIREGSKLSVSIAWQEIQELLTKIGNRIADRNTKDIIVFWMDAISYEKSEGMPYLSAIKETAVSFTEAFTVTPHTGATLKNIFCQKMLIDDLAYKIEKIDRSNSEMLCYLEDKGYKVNIISGYWTELIENFEVENKPGLFYPSSYVFWGVLENLLEEGSRCPKFILAHALIEGHSPFISASVKRNDVVEERILAGKTELDKQLEFYNRFLNPDDIRIFMSDHGQYDFKTRFHIHFNICSSNIKPKKIEQLFSIMDFFPALKEILEEGEVFEEGLKREYLPIEDMDWYSRTEIENMFRDKMPLDVFKFGYRGVVAKDAICARFSTGVEWSICRNGGGAFEPQLFPQNQNQIDVSEFVTLLRDYPEKLKEDKKFVYSAYPYQLFLKYTEQSRKVMKIIEEIVLRYEDTSVAVRFGGMHSRELYSLLSEEAQRKVACFIDNNEKCICAEFGKPVLNVTEFALSEKDTLHLKAVVLSSFDHLQLLRTEAKTYPADLEIIDIYKILEERGICCKENFYGKMGMTDADYEEIFSPKLVE